MESMESIHGRGATRQSARERIPAWPCGHIFHPPTHAPGANHPLYPTKPPAPPRPQCPAAPTSAPEPAGPWAGGTRGPGGGRAGEGRLEAGGVLRGGGGPGQDGGRVGGGGMPGGRGTGPRGGGGGPGPKAWGAGAGAREKGRHQVHIVDGYGTPPLARRKPGELSASPSPSFTTSLSLSEPMDKKLHFPALLFRNRFQARCEK